MWLPLKRSRVIVWERERLAYVRVPKCANQTIRRALPDGVQHRLDLRKLDERFGGYLTFSFVRNPWARLVSAYNEKIRAEGPTTKNFVDGVHKGLLALDPNIRVGIPFAEFAELACKLTDAETEKHLRSQCFYLVRDARPVPRFIGKVERMAEDWRRICEQAGIHADLGHWNRRPHARYTEYYADPALRDLVAERYREDIETFGYDFDA